MLYSKSMLTRDFKEELLLKNNIVNVSSAKRLMVAKGLLHGDH